VLRSVRRTQRKSDREVTSCDFVLISGSATALCCTCRLRHRLTFRRAVSDRRHLHRRRFVDRCGAGMAVSLSRRLG
jgi:hypothetical protein